MLRKQPKPDWEILSYLSNTEHPYIIYPESFGWNNAVIRDYPIHSVKRLSDGEVFCIGDIMNMDDRTFPIIGFVINGPWMMLKHNDTDSWNIDYVKKVKEVLFTTEDGVAVYGGNQIWLVFENFSIDSYHYLITEKGPIERSDKIKYFSTKEVAEDYVLWNKETLSLNEIKELGDIFNHRSNIYFQKLIQRAEEKLNTTNPNK